MLWVKSKGDKNGQALERACGELVCLLFVVVVFWFLPKCNRISFQSLESQTQNSGCNYYLYVLNNYIPRCTTAVCCGVLGLIFG